MSDTRFDIDLSPLYEMGGGKDFVVLILGKMIKSMPESFTTMKNTTEKKEWAALKSAAHKAKSTFAYLRLNDIKDQLANIEYSAMEGNNLDRLPSMVDKVISEGEEVLGALKQKMVELI